MSQDADPQSTPKMLVDAPSFTELLPPLSMESLFGSGATMLSWQGEALGELPRLNDEHRRVLRALAWHATDLGYRKAQREIRQALGINDE